MNLKNKILDIWKVIVEFYKESNKRCLFIYCFVELMWFIMFYKMGIRYTMGEWKRIGLI